MPNGRRGAKSGSDEVWHVLVLVLENPTTNAWAVLVKKSRSNGANRAKEDFGDELVCCGTRGYNVAISNEGIYKRGNAYKLGTLNKPSGAGRKVRVVVLSYL